jgi:hypothetical protein
MSAYDPEIGDPPELWLRRIDPASRPRPGCETSACMSPNDATNSGIAFASRSRLNLGFVAGG